MSSFFNPESVKRLSTEILQAEYGALCNQVQSLTVQSLRDRAASAALVIRAELLTRLINEKSTHPLLSCSNAKHLLGNAPASRLHNIN